MLDKYDCMTTMIDEIKIYYDNINKRVKIIEYRKISVQILKKLIDFSFSKHVGKIICNCNLEDCELFLEAGFEVEGIIEGYFKGKDALCMSYFLDSNRKNTSDNEQKNLIIKKCSEVKNTYKQNKNNNLMYKIRNANENDIKEMIQLFSVIFSSYPSPIYDEAYIKQNMKGKVIYKVAVANGKIVGIASAEMDNSNMNAEITDCATDSEYRGQGILCNIINHLEEDLKTMGFIALYSLSRAKNPSVNIALSKHNYKYSGRLINNCTICGSFEDMNIWVKRLQ